MSHAYNLKYIIVGDIGVGKSSLRTSFGGQPFHPRHDMTIGIEYESRVIQVAGLPFQIAIYDAPGNPSFRKLSRPYYRSLACVLVVYDVSRRETFSAVGEWIDEARRNTREDVVVVLVGNKRDRDERRQVGFSEGQEFASANGTMFVETSAKTKENVDMLFRDSAHAVYERILSNRYDVDNEFHGVSLGDVKDPSYSRRRGAGGSISGVYEGLDGEGTSDGCCSGCSIC